MANSSSKGSKKPSKASNTNKKTSVNKESSNNTSDSPTSASNKPRNLLITDATTPFEFEYHQKHNRIRQCFTVYQTAADETWPGGALWDLGVVLAEFIVMLRGGEVNVSLTTHHRDDTQAGASSSSSSLCRTLSFRNNDIPSTLSKATFNTILELGCGVGLTGLVAASAWNAKLCLLTDLQVVIDGVTKRNVEHNVNKNCKVMAVPLCWGNPEDEDRVLELLATNQETTSGGRRPSRKKTTSKQQEQDSSAATHILPDAVIIGDVAYQHKPGAPSHFDALLSTLLKFTDAHTTVFFGTRIRMPASNDLLELFLQHFDPMVQMPADEIDGSFRNKKHNMTIHVLKRKSGEASRVP